MEIQNRPSLHRVRIQIVDMHWKTSNPNSKVQHMRDYNLRNKEKINKHSLLLQLPSIRNKSLLLPCCHSRVIIDLQCSSAVTHYDDPTQTCFLGFDHCFHYCFLGCQKFRSSGTWLNNDKDIYLSISESGRPSDLINNLNIQYTLYVALT